jgi:DMSO/TMAO reductase YedYZ molybdopterin-dependent catalytic subunit
MSDPIDRRQFLGMAAATALSAEVVAPEAKAEAIAPAARKSDQAPDNPRPFLTAARDFVDVSRGKPKPYTLKGDALVRARLTAGTWRLEIVGDGSSEVARPRRLEDGTALDLAALEELGKSHGVKYLKAMQCNNIPAPLGQGLWEGVPLREVIGRVGRIGDVRRVYFWGFHNNDPAQLFQSSLPYNRAMETPPWEPPPLVAYRLNGEPIPLERGGPVRMVVPWAHGFKSIKWLQRIVLTNDYKANDTYALQNNDPESYLKTAAYLGKGATSFSGGLSVLKAGEPIEIEGMAMAGWSGLKRVEYWLRPGGGDGATLDDDDPAWKAAVWRPCEIMRPPDDWDAILPKGASSKQIWGFDPTTGRPRSWPLPFSMVSWTARLTGLQPGSYEFRARTVDLNGFAQPEPRPYQKAGMNQVPCRNLIVKA